MDEPLHGHDACESETDGGIVPAVWYKAHRRKNMDINAFLVENGYHVCEPNTNEYNLGIKNMSAFMMDSNDVETLWYNPERQAYAIMTLDLTIVIV